MSVSPRGLTPPGRDNVDTAARLGLHGTPYMVIPGSPIEGARMQCVLVTRYWREVTCALFPETTAKAQLIVGLGTMAFSHTEATARAVATLASFVTLSLPLHCH